MWTLYRKELRELLRDKKAFWFTILMPTVILPFVMAVGGLLIVKAVSNLQSETFYFLVNADVPEVVKSDIAEFDNFELVDENAAIYNDLVEEQIVLQPGVLDFVVSFNASSGQFQLYYHETRPAIESLIVEQVRSVIAAFQEEQKTSRLQNLGATQADIDWFNAPVALELLNQAPAQETWGERIGGILPYFLILIALTGAMYPAIDLGAGEKERGTIEALLLTPLSRLQIVFAKFLVIVTTSLASVLLTVLSAFVWLQVVKAFLPPDISLPADISLSTLTLLGMIGLLLPIIVIFAAILLSLSIYARSFKEAQNYMGAVVFMVAMPVLLSFIPGVELDYFWSFVPLTNVALAIKELAKGTFDVMFLLPILFTMGAVAAVLLRFSVKWFQRETVLFR